jgi:large subunit ribosomal protein L21
MKFAVIGTGGKQYLVRPEEMKVGDRLTFDQVLLAGDQDSLQVGTPVMNSLTVHATLVENGRHKKVEVLKYKAKSRYRKRYGHRQPFTKVKIESIN